MQWIVAAVVLLVAGAAGWWFGGAPEPSPPLRVTAATTTGGMVTVHVAGEVAMPGLVEVAAGGRVADAVAAAGGMLDTADTRALNLAAPVADGQQIVVPGVSDSPVAEAAGPVRLNTATAADLEAIPGVGPVLAARIIEYRSVNGPFMAVEDLLDVAGIGEAKLEAMREAVAVP